MDLFSVLLIVFAIGYLLRKIFSKKSSQGRSYNLTDTQLNFRQHQIKDQLQSLTDQLSPDQQKVIEINEYIKQNIRPFRFWEWLYWTVESRFLLSYGLAMSMVLGWIFLPFYFGVPIFPIISFWAFMYVDVLLYKRRNFLAVIKWDSEFTRRYGKFLEDFDRKYK